MHKYIPFAVAALFFILGISFVCSKRPIPITEEQLPPAVRESYWIQSKKSQYVFVLDYSGSMKNKNVFEALKNSLETILYKQVNIGDRVSVIQFASDAKILISNHEITKNADRDAVWNVIQKIRPTGAWTDIAEGYRASVEEMQKLQGLNPHFKSYLMVFTDNIDDPPPHKAVTIQRSFDQYMNLWKQFQGLKTYLAESPGKPETTPTGTEPPNSVEPNHVVPSVTNLHPIHALSEPMRKRVLEFQSNVQRLQPKGFSLNRTTYDKILGEYQKILQDLEEEPNRESANMVIALIESQRDEIQTVNKALLDYEEERLQTVDLASTSMGDLQAHKILIYPQDENPSIDPRAGFIGVPYGGENIEKQITASSQKAQTIDSIFLLLPAGIVFILFLLLRSPVLPAFYGATFAFLLTIAFLPIVEPFLIQSSQRFQSIVSPGSLK